MFGVASESRSQLRAGILSERTASAQGDLVWGNLVIGICLRLSSTEEEPIAKFTSWIAGDSLDQAWITLRSRSNGGGLSLTAGVFAAAVLGVATRHGESASYSIPAGRALFLLRWRRLCGVNGRSVPRSSLVSHPDAGGPSLTLHITGDI